MRIDRVYRKLAGRAPAGQYWHQTLSGNVVLESEARTKHHAVPSDRDLVHKGGVRGDKWS